MSRRVMLAGAVTLLVAGWLVARLFLEVDVRFSDVPLYRQYGERIMDGAVPYRDVPIEYPPAALPLFVVPAALSDDLHGFRLAFEAMLLVAAAGALAVTLGASEACGAAGRRTAGALALVALAPLLLGRVSFERYDLWPAFLAAAGVCALLAGRFRLSGFALGLGAAAKLFPLALVPLLAAAALRRRGRREAVISVLVAVVTFLACFAPFLVVAPEETLDVLTRQLERPLQLESLGSSVLLVAHQVAGLDVGIEFSYGSTNLGGARAELVAALLAFAAVVLLVAVWAAAFRDRRPELTAAAAMAIVVVLGKVLSPQFLLWLVPLVVLVPSAAAWLLTGAGLVVTQLYFPDRWLALIRLEPGPIWLLALRNALLVLLLAVLLARLRYDRQPPVSPL